MSDTQWDGDKVPDGLADAMSGKHLGDPAVVGALVAEFAEHIMAMLSACASGEFDNDALDAKIKNACLKMSVIFTGGDPAFSATEWNTAQYAGLQTKARGLLASARAHFGQDDNFDPSHPVAGLFHILARQCISAYKSAEHGDGEHPLPETMQYVIGILLNLPEVPR